MQVAHPHPGLAQVVGEVLGHLLGEGGDQGALPALGADMDLAEQVVDLPLAGTHLDDRVDEPGGTDDLLDGALRALRLVGAGGGARVDELTHHRVPLLEGERPVVERRGQPEPVLHQGDLPRAVAAEHAPDLGDRDVGLVDDHQRVLGEVVEQAVGTLALGAAAEVAAVVLDSGAGAGLAEHLQVEVGALAQPLRLEQAAARLELAAALLELGLDPVHRALELLARGDVVARGEDGELVAHPQDLAGERVEVADRLDLVAEELDPGRDLLVRRLDVDDVAAHPEARASEVEVVARVLQVGELAQHDVAADRVADLHAQRLAEVVLR